MAYWVLVGKQSYEDGGRDVDRPLLVAETEKLRDIVHDEIEALLKTGGAVSDTLQRNVHMPEVPATVIEATMQENAVKLFPKNFDAATDAYQAPAAYGNRLDSDYTYDLMWFRLRG